MRSSSRRPRSTGSTTSPARSPSNPAAARWHYHDGRVFGVVREGTLTRTMKDCSVVVSPEGSAVTEDSGADHTHIGRNLGPGPLVLWVDYIEPAGTPLAVDMPDPGCG